MKKAGFEMTKYFGNAQVLVFLGTFGFGPRAIGMPSSSVSF